MKIDQTSFALGHALLDGLPMAMAEGMAKLHDGCMCWLEPRV